MHHFRGKLFQGDKLVLDPANVYIDYHASEADASLGVGRLPRGRFGEGRGGWGQLHAETGGRPGRKASDQRLRARRLGQVPCDVRRGGIIRVGRRWASHHAAASLLTDLVEKQQQDERAVKSGSGSDPVGSFTRR